MGKKTRDLFKINSTKLTANHNQPGRWLKKKIQLAILESKLEEVLTRITKIIGHRGTICIRPFIFCNMPHTRVKHGQFLRG